MSKILSTPHPIGFGWAYALIPAAVVFFILVFLAPYGFDELNMMDRFILACPFTLITALAAPLNLFLAKQLLPKHIHEEKWTLGREFLYDIYDFALIGLWNAIFLKLSFRAEEPFVPLLLRLELHTLLVGIIPLMALIAYKHQRAIQRQLNLSSRITEELKNKLAKQSEDNAVILRSETGVFEIKLGSNKIVGLVAEGNYAEVHFMEDGKPKKHLIRNRLKSLLDLLPSDEFMHCHKSYVVNMKHVVRAEGNARDLKLTLTNGMAAPVSRGKSKELLNRLNS